MPTSYLAYWKPATVDAQDVGDPLRHAASEQFGQLSIGDTVWIATVRVGGLRLVGRLTVGAVTTRAGAARKLRVPTRSIWAASHHILAAPGSAEAMRDVPIPVQLAAKIRFASESSSRLHLQNGRVNPQQLQRMRQLTPAGESPLRQLWGDQTSHKREAEPGRNARLWLYQINTREYFDTKERIATTTANLFSFALPKPVLDWGVKQNAAAARAGDVVLIRSSDPAEPGVVGLARVIGTHLEPHYNRVRLRPDLDASALLRANPIPIDWISRIVNPDKVTKPNLVDLVPFADKILQQLSRRGVELVDGPSAGTLPTPGQDEEDQQSWFKTPLKKEGRPVWRKNLQRESHNRRRVLNVRQRPWACEACGFEFGAVFGAKYADYIQVHHQRPVGRGERVPAIHEFDLLCANCHAIAHWKQPLKPLRVEQIRSILRRAVRYRAKPSSAS